MPEIYCTAVLESMVESAALVVHCSDPRYQPLSLAKMMTDFEINSLRTGL